jgi:hypothetical protein
MQIEQSPSSITPSNLVRLGGNHGYRFEGDTAILTAELELSGGDLTAHGDKQLALQLWACDFPHQGGQLQGLKVAEAALAPIEGERAYFETASFAHLPPLQSDYNMVLVLAAGEQGRYDQVQDFANYAQRQQFTGPRLEGTVGYRFDGAGVVLSAERVRNAREEGNLSGSLTLELWALPRAYEGGQLTGTILASTGLGRIAGQREERDIERYAPLNPPEPGTWQLALALTEFTAAGYVTRDVSSFAMPYVVDAPAPAARELATNELVASSKSEPASAKPAEAPASAAAAVKPSEAAKATSAISAAAKVAEAAKITGSTTKEAEAVSAASGGTMQAELLKSAANAKDSELAKAAKAEAASKPTPVATKAAESVKPAASATPSAAASKDAPKVAAKETETPKLSVVKDAPAKGTPVVSQN